MSLKLEMLRAAQRAPRLLGDSAALVRAFLLGKQNADGGFQDRSGASDLYYTVFGIDALAALKESPDKTRLEKFLLTFGDGNALDFVHLTCLARCWSALPGKLPDATRTAITARLANYRAADGGFAPTPNAPHSTAYACLLGGDAFQSLEKSGGFFSIHWKKSGPSFPSIGKMRRDLFQLLEHLRTADGAYANERGLTHGSTTATAAAVALLRAAKGSVPPEIGPWLLARRHRDGGFVASTQTPIPDLLSTATALHALAALGVSLAPVREPCLNFIDSLWSNEGGFHGHWADDALDVEYTFYALLALGHLDG